MTDDDPVARRRERIMRQLARGRLTQAEAAELAGVSRQRIHQEVLVRRIHPVAARNRYLRNLINGHART